MPSTQTFLWKQAFGNHRYRILFVDDKLYALKSVSEILENAGYVVYTAQTYDSALEILENRHIHLGIFDLNLAGESESASDPEPRNYEGFALANRDNFPLLRIVYSGKTEHEIVVSALNHPQTVDFIVKGEDIEETLLAKVNSALVQSLRINQDLHLHWHNTSLQQIVQTAYPELPIEQQMEHILELEDLFRMQYLDFAGDICEQASITKMETDKIGRVWLKVSAYTGSGRRNDSLVLCGKRETLIIEDELFDSLSPRSQHIPSRPFQTIHYGIHAYDVFEGNISHVHTLAHYLLKREDDFVADVLERIHSQRFQNRYRNSQRQEKDTLYHLAKGEKASPDWKVTERLFEIAGRIVDEWQNLVPQLRLRSNQSQITYSTGSDEQTYPHPIIYLETLCNLEVTRPIGMTHGDLQVNSIFANAHNDKVYLLDYTGAGERSLLRDYVTLERSIQLEIISQVNIENYQVLAKMLTGVEDDLSSSPVDLQRAIHHIRQIRELALQDTGCELKDYLQDFYIDLVNFLLTYPRRAFAGYETVRKYAHCLLLAGQICQELEENGVLAPGEAVNEDGVWLDAENYRVRIYGKTIDLTEKQFGLFEYLYNNLDRNCTYADIIEKGLHEEFLHDDIKLEKPRIQTAVSRLRPELSKFGFRIEAWRNGYRLVRDDPQ